jgi:hypothetical protein
MKRWMLLAVVIVTLLAVTGALAFRFAQTRLASHPAPTVLHLARTPDLAYKFNLCLEAYAFVASGPAEIYRTDYSFPDPFRRANDTIIPILVDWNPADNSVSFQIAIIVGHVQTFHESIAHVEALDGISVMLPDAQNQLERANEPQFIVSAIGKGGEAAVLDYTCPQEWKWNIVV